MIAADGDISVLAASAASLIRTVPQRFALYLDVDGTLIDIAPHPDQVIVPPTLVRDLSVLHERLSGALAILSGRPVASTDRILAPLKLAGAGVHGAEVRLMRDGGVVSRVAEFPAHLRDEIFGFIRGMKEPAIVLEEKGAALAVHVRAAPHLEGHVLDMLREVVSRSDKGLRVEHGRRVIEILPALVSKGVGLAEISQTSPFEGRRPIVIGDDLSDEAAFIIAKEAGGFALPVAGENFRREEAAFRSPEDVRAWLSDLAGSKPL